VRVGIGVNVAKPRALGGKAVADSLGEQLAPRRSAIEIGRIRFTASA